MILGHADVGKSSLCGRIMLESGQLEEREIAKYKQDAIANKRESWWLAYAMDRDKFE